MQTLLNITATRNLDNPRRTNVPMGIWILLPLIAVWPSWRWNVSRLNDGSDDRIGSLAIITLIGWVWRQRDSMRAHPPQVGAMLSLSLAAIGVLSSPFATPLFSSFFATLSFMTMLLALRTPGQPRLAWLGLGLLSLPLITSLQFTAGYPLRVLTAELSSLLLSVGGIIATRHGATLFINGQMIMVDAPCAGIHMGWMAYFCAFLTAGLLSQQDRQLLQRLPWVGLVVLMGNVIRNTLLLIKEAPLITLPDWTHEGIGMVIFTLMCGLVIRIVAGGKTPMDEPLTTSIQATFIPISRADNTLENRNTFVVIAGFGVLAALNFVLKSDFAANPHPAHAIEWPVEFKGERLQPQALSAVEKRFSEGFPGAIARFRKGQDTVVLRHVVAPTRKLHPASDCYKGAGYAISDIQLRKQIHNGQQTSNLQRCFSAALNQNTLKVCEYIQDSAGNTYTDTSAWYWAALTGVTQPPWLAVTTATPQNRSYGGT